LVVMKSGPQVPDIPESPRLRDLITACLSLDSAARPRADEVVKVCDLVCVSQFCVMLCVRMFAKVGNVARYEDFGGRCCRLLENKSCT